MLYIIHIHIWDAIWLFYHFSAGPFIDETNVSIVKCLINRYGLTIGWMLTRKKTFYSIKDQGRSNFFLIELYIILCMKFYWIIYHFITEMVYYIMHGYKFRFEYPYAWNSVHRHTILGRTVVQYGKGGNFIESCRIVMVCEGRFSNF